MMLVTLTWIEISPVNIAVFDYCRPSASGLMDWEIVYANTSVRCPLSSHHIITIYLTFTLLKSVYGVHFMKNQTVDGVNKCEWLFSVKQKVQHCQWKHRRCWIFNNMLVWKAYKTINYTFPICWSVFRQCYLATKHFMFPIALFFQRKLSRK